jgi:hypothetical protein
MRKVCLIVLGILFAFATASYAAGGTVSDISSEKWLDHLAQMQVMRQQILRLLTKPSPTVRDKEMLDALQKSFNEKKNEWDSYIEDVALGLTEEKEVKQTYCSSRGKRLCDCGEGDTECTTTTTMSCGNHKQAKKHFKKSHKARKKGHDCGSCPSKKSVCVTSCKTTVVCNGGVDCPSCPNYRTSRCCKVSGKCSSGHDCQHKHEVKRTHKDGECPICREYRLMKINRKCSRCAG